MHLLLAAGVQHVIVDATNVDPIAVEAAWYAKATFWATIAAIIIATIAAYVAWRTLRYDTQQFEDFLRRPDIKAHHWPSYHPSNDGANRVVIINVEVWNEGNRVSRDGMMEILVPNEAFVVPLQDDNPTLRRINGFKYIPYQRPYSLTLYPNSVRITLPNNGFRFGVWTDVTQLPVLWRIYDDYGQYPQDDWGKWELQPK